MWSVWQGIFNIIHRGFWFHPAGMCSALQGSEGPFCVNSPQKENRKKSLPPTFGYLLLSYLPFSPSIHLYFLFWFGLYFLRLNWRWFVKRSCFTLRGSWERLNAVKVIAEMAPKLDGCFWNLALVCLRFWSLRQCQTSLSILNKNSSGVALAAADIAFLQHLEKCPFSLLLKMHWQ